MTTRRGKALTVPLLFALAIRAPGAETGHGPNGLFRTAVPDAPYSLILGRPTDSSVTLSVLSPADREGYVRYGAEGGPLTKTTATMRFRAGETGDLVIGGLTPDARYAYEFCNRPGTTGVFAADAGHAFRTRRAAGRPFTFTITADSHLDENTDPAIYAASLRSALSGRPDFHIDLGDTFMTDKRGNRPQDAYPQYLAQRYYFGLLCHSASLFLVPGNHDGESGRSLDVATGMRRRLFPNPVPGAFYSGSTNGNYYAWHWGDALCVVLDPYRYSAGQGRAGERDGWGFTLGRTQYDWLKQTLAGSSAPFKFVFIHNLVGGLDRQGRGGAEAVPFFEWGGRGLDGRDTFASQRPGWPMPIHALLVRYGVAAVFHGHDHFYARQDVDGVIYQLVPQPGHPGEGSILRAADYGYRNGDTTPGAGYLRVTVDRDSAGIDFVRLTDEPPSRGQRPGTVAAGYRIAARLP